MINPFAEEERFLFISYPAWIKKLLIMRIFVLIFLFSFWACSPYTTDVNQLKQDILNSACDEELRRFLSDRINKLERSLSRDQLIKNLNDIRSDLNCD